MEFFKIIIFNRLKYGSGYRKEEKRMKNFGDLMQQAKKIQNRLARIQEEMAEKTVEASSGGGMVTVTANGRQEVVSIKIEPEVVNPDDVEMLQDLIQAAVNDALRKSQEMVSQEMAKITGGIKIPGLF
jgi:DNA-binding YbaB/EbfC family protein